MPASVVDVVVVGRYEYQTRKELTHQALKQFATALRLPLVAES
jgi:hypothetical protein